MSGNTIGPRNATDVGRLSTGSEIGSDLPAGTTGTTTPEFQYNRMLRRMLTCDQIVHASFRHCSVIPPNVCRRFPHYAHVQPARASNSTFALYDCVTKRSVTTDARGTLVRTCLRCALNDFAPTHLPSYFRAWNSYAISQQFRLSSWQ